MCATDLDVTVEADLATPDAYKTLDWGNYQVGVAAELMKDGIDVCGADLLFLSQEHPRAAGLLRQLRKRQEKDADPAESVLPSDRRYPE